MVHVVYSIPAVLLALTWLELCMAERISFTFIYSVLSTQSSYSYFMFITGSQCPGSSFACFQPPIFSLHLSRPPRSKHWAARLGSSWMVTTVCAVPGREGLLPAERVPGTGSRRCERGHEEWTRVEMALGRGHETPPEGRECRTIT